MFFKKDKLLFEIYHDHLDHEELIVEILHKIAAEKRKPVKKIKKLLLIKKNKQNKEINRRFWEILDALMPGHCYNYVGCCAECGALELREQLPESMEQS